MQVFLKQAIRFQASSVMLSVPKHAPVKQDPVLEFAGLFNRLLYLAIVRQEFRRTDIDRYHHVALHDLDHKIYQTFHASCEAFRQLFLRDSGSQVKQHLRTMAQKALHEQLKRRGNLLKNHQPPLEGRRETQVRRVEKHILSLRHLMAALDPNAVDFLPALDRSIFSKAATRRAYLNEPLVPLNQACLLEVLQTAKISPPKSLQRFDSNEARFWSQYYLQAIILQDPERHRLPKELVDDPGPHNNIT